MHRREIARQLVHLSGISTVLVALFIGKYITGAAAIAVSIFTYFLSWWTIRKHDLRKKLPLRIKEIEEVEDKTHEMLNSLEREKSLKKIPYYGAITFFFAIGITLLILPLQWATLAIVILSVGDAVATLVGIHIGKHSLPHNSEKTVEGTFSFFISTFVLLLILTTPENALILASITASIETLPYLNDNFSIPVTVGLLFFIL